MSQDVASGLTSSTTPLGSGGGPAFFNQIPQQRTPVLIFQGPILATTWTKLLDTPRNPYIQIQDLWIGNQGGAAMDLYFAMVASGSTFSNVGGVTQMDVFQLCSSAVHLYRESNAYISVNPKQALWFYSTQACNLRISGLQVKV